MMLTACEGIYRNGKIELLQPLPAELAGRVIVTFLCDEEGVKLTDHDVSCAQAADLRQRLKPFVEDWSQPEMAVYDRL